MRLIIVFVLYMAITTTTAMAETNSVVSVGTFSHSERPLWQEKSFKDHTNYQFIAEENSFALKAYCDGAASALYRNMEIDLTKTPILRWSWKIDETHAGLDDVSKEGDDYAARVYVVYKGKMPWDVIAINYVWANKQLLGTSWPNAYSSRAVMVAQESGTPDKENSWIEESRDVLEDFKRYFGRDIRRIDGIAIMTDCDNGGGKTTGYYRSIQFISK